VSPLKSPKQPAVAVPAAAQRTRSRSPGAAAAAAAAARSRSHSPLPAAAKSSSGSSPKGEDVDPAITRKLYDIADLLSMRPAEPSRPSALNPPADLNILWDGKELEIGTGGAPSSSWSQQGSAASGGGSGFNTPRVSFCLI
jgi:hypothetical protein